MPELPEVEIMTRNIQKWFDKRTIVIDIVDERWLKQGEIQTIQNKIVERVSRRAKYTLVHFHDDVLILHFRMTGKIIPHTDPMKKKQRKERVFFHCNDEEQRDSYVFVDSRCLGEGRILSKSEISDFFINIGPEPWPEKLSGSFLQKRFSVKKHSPIKNAALDQNIIAGIGNILACESLYKSRISPLKKVSALTEHEWSLWSEKIVATINLIIDKESSDEIVYVNEGGENIFEVYAREGEDCSICSDTIQRIKQSGRSTFYCPTCQKI